MVGILTFHRALNYGAVLQAYALQQCLNSLGIENKIIDYRCSYIENFYKPIKLSHIKNPSSLARDVIYLKGNRKKRAKFNKFCNDYLLKSDPVYKHEDLKVLNKDYSSFITGSDQVWNNVWSGFDRSYFLDFADNQKKNSYAASFGFEEIPPDLKNEYKLLLSDFNKLSVREKSGQRIINEALNRNSVVSIDPSCLLSADTWNNIAEKPKEKDYVLLYTLEKSAKLESLAKELAKKHNTKVIYIIDSVRKKKGYDCKGFLSPLEFVGLFSNAKIVVTNSFHGLMFSTILKKEFYLAYQERKNAPNSRLMDFVSEFHLGHRVINDSEFSPGKEIDYEYVESLMAKKRLQAITYLRDICKKTVPVQKNYCCGCRACEQICHVHAIEMKRDAEGFLYPVVDEAKCVNCGACIKVCNFSKIKLNSNKKPERTVLAKHIKPEVRTLSRSGGVFVVLSDFILEKKGAVYGVAITSDFKVVHERTSTVDGRNRFCGSKYVQSDTGDMFSSVYEDLKNETPVLFSGTACQVDGLISFLKNKHLSDQFFSNLYTCDIVCHGVVSPLIWEDNVKYIKKENKNSTLKTINFRDKTFGWDSHIETYFFDNKSVQSTKYTSVFYEHTALRPCCYNCPYASTDRISDITLADAWGAKKYFPLFDDNKGVSLILINNIRGQDLFNQLKYLEVQDVDITLMMQPNLMHPTHIPHNRNNFWKMYKTKGYEYVANKCFVQQQKIKTINRYKAKVVSLLKSLKLK